MTFAQDILAAVGDETIEAIAIGPYRRWTDEGADHTLGPGPVSWEQALPVLDYPYDAGFGGQDCHDFWLWTPTRVLFIHEYDGATSVASAPRHPTPFEGATQ